MAAHCDPQGHILMHLSPLLLLSDITGLCKVLGRKRDRERQREREREEREKAAQSFPYISRAVAVCRHCLQSLYGSQGCLDRSICHKLFHIGHIFAPIYTDRKKETILFT
jgi:hypothetical protein